MDSRCERCWLVKEYCYCQELVMVPALTKITVVMHVAERNKTSNTARVIELCTPDCTVQVVGKKDAPFHGIPRDPAEQSLVLFPEPNAPVLTTSMRDDLASVGRIHLIVPDGSWSQAKRMVHRNTYLAGIPRVSLSLQSPSQYRLRRNIRSGGVCTVEAVAAALAILEGPEIAEPLLRNFELMRDRILMSRSGVHRAAV